MKTLTVNEAVRNLDVLLKQAVAREEIGIRSDDTIVVLRPLQRDPQKALTPREALRQLQSEARLSSAQAEGYLREFMMNGLRIKSIRNDFFRDELPDWAAGSRIPRGFRS